MLKEILTRAVLSKGKVETISEESVMVKKEANKLIGCWIINSNYLTIVENSTVYLEGTYDVHLWYALNEDKDTVIEKKTIMYKDVFEFDGKFNPDEAEYKLYCVEYPHCSNMVLEGDIAKITVEKKFAIDTIGETKLMVEVNEGFNEIKINQDFLK